MFCCDGSEDCEAEPEEHEDEEVPDEAVAEEAVEEVGVAVVVGTASAVALAPISG